MRQAYAALYEWHAGYKLSASAFDKVGAAKVLQTLQRFARKEGVEQHIIFGTEAVSVREQPDGRCVRRHPFNQACQGVLPHKVCWHRFRLVCKDVTTGKEDAMTADAVLVCTGVLGENMLVACLACQAASLQPPSSPCRLIGACIAQKPEATCSLCDICLNAR